VTEANVRALDLANGGGYNRFAGAPPVFRPVDPYQTGRPAMFANRSGKLVRPEWPPRLPDVAASSASSAAAEPSDHTPTTPAPVARPFTGPSRRALPFLETTPPPPLEFESRIHRREPSAQL